MNDINVRIFRLEKSSVRNAKRKARCLKKKEALLEWEEISQDRVELGSQISKISRQSPASSEARSTSVLDRMGKKLRGRNNKDAESIRKRSRRCELEEGDAMSDLRAPTTRVMLQDPLDDNDVPIVEEFQKRLSSANLNSQVQGDDEENSGPENNLDTSEENDFPFEFQALEVALEAVCSFLDTRTRELEVSAYPALDELKSKFMEFQRKTEMTRITFVTFKEAPGADIAMLLLPANWDDKEYIDDPNHVKPEVAMGNIFVYVLAQWMAPYEGNEDGDFDPSHNSEITNSHGASDEEESPKKDVARLKKGKWAREETTATIDLPNRITRKVTMTSEHLVNPVRAHQPELKEKGGLTIAEVGKTGEARADLDP
ncbi:hypothetical protein AgCh_000590 [Apium graveolens]